MIKRAIVSLFSKFGFTIVDSAIWMDIQNRSYAQNTLTLLEHLPAGQLDRLVEYSKESKAQLGQDLFALSETDLKSNGFFVEFGATNGFELSNTYMLEKRFGWSGILAEPAKVWHTDIQNNRTAYIETNCVWTESNLKLEFNETRYPEVSTIDTFTKSDSHLNSRRNGKKYQVTTISLNDLLAKYNAPYSIDYLSIDTEGSELEILQAFDFSKHQISVITVEHNFTQQREQIYQLLTSKGYTRKLEHISQFDDWYVLAR